MMSVLMGLSTRPRVGGQVTVCLLLRWSSKMTRFPWQLKPKEVGASKPGRKSGWWTDEAPKSGKRKDTFQEPEDERLKGTSRDYDSDNDIPLIPDLDEVQEEELAHEVAKAPQMAVNRVATYKELDSDLLKHAAFATLDDIDLRALMQCLVPESELKEEDVPWSWDVLFTEVTSELNTEWETETETDNASSTNL